MFKQYFGDPNFSQAVATLKRLYDFYLNESPIIFIMGVVGSPRDVDEKLGEWANDIHLA